MLKVATVLPYEPYREYKEVEQVYSGSTEIDKIIDKNGNVLFAVSKEVEGTPPLTYKGKEDTNLKNYRIYGQTVNGESVGDGTGNLFDSNINVISGYLSDEGILKPANDTSQITFDYIPIISGTYTLTYTIPTVYELWFGVCTYDESRTFQSRLVSEYSGATTFTIPNTTKYIRISLRGYNKTPIIMLNEGSTALPYEPYGYKMPVTVTNGTDTETTNLYLPEQIKMVGDEAEYVDYKEQKLHRVRKNLLQNTATNLTTYGVTITVNDDGSVTCNGTATSTIIFLLFEKKLGQNTYILSGCPENGAQNERYKIQINPDNGWYSDIGNGFEFEIQNTSTIKVRLVIYPSYTCNNLTFYPMIRLASIADDTYEPYIEDTELDVTLPALPTLSGTNTLTVGTEVQPSNVYLKGRIKEIA